MVPRDYWSLTGLVTVILQDQGNHRIRKVDISGYISTVAGNGYTGTTGMAALRLTQSIGIPGGLAIDGGGIYILLREKRVVVFEKLRLLAALLTAPAGLPQLQETGYRVFQVTGARQLLRN